MIILFMHLLEILADLHFKSQREGFIVKLDGQGGQILSARNLLISYYLTYLFGYYLDYFCFLFLFQIL